MSDDVNVPQLRFPEFNEKWKETKLGEIVKINSGKSPKNLISDNGTIPYFKVEQLNNSTKYQKETPYFIEEPFETIPQGSIIFPKRGAAILLNKIRILEQDSFMDTNLMTLTIDDTCSNEFIYYFIEKEDLSKIADTTSIPQLNNKHINPYPIHLPSNNEQDKIANFLSCVDKKIELLENKKFTIETFKYNLFKHFFNSVENAPKCLLKDLFDFKKGSGLSKEKIDVGGKYPMVLYGELYTTYDEIISNISSFTNSDEGVLSEKGDFLIPASTTTNGLDLVTASVVREEGIRLGGDINILRKKEDLNSIYMACLLKYNMKREILRLTQGSTIIHLYGKDLKELNVNLPSREIQDNFANIVKFYNEKQKLINIQINEMNKFKKGLLQQMFV